MSLSGNVIHTKMPFWWPLLPLWERIEVRGITPILTFPLRGKGHLAARFSYTVVPVASGMDDSDRRASQPPNQSQSNCLSIRYPEKDADVAGLPTLDRAFLYIMGRMGETGAAPHFSELAAEMVIPMEEGRNLVHEIMATGFPGWLHPDTDWIASFPPFSNIPTQYRITIDGQQKWYAQ